MPYTDPEKDKAVKRRWRERSIEAGYGKALYARRAQRLRNEKILRDGITEALLAFSANDWRRAIERLVKALDDAPEPGPPKDYMPDQRQIASGLEENEKQRHSFMRMTGVKEKPRLRGSDSKTPGKNRP